MLQSLACIGRAYIYVTVWIGSAQSEACLTIFPAYSFDKLGRVQKMLGGHHNTPLERRNWFPPGQS